MIKPTLNIKIGESYSSSHILNEINIFPSRIQVGHATMKDKNGDRHLYYVNETQLKNLKDTELKVLSIINPCEQNFAHKLIFSKETQENLKKIDAQKNLCYAIDMNDLIQAGYTFKTLSIAINCINCVFKKNEMTFTASKYSEGKIDRKYFVKISYKAIDNVIKQNEDCIIEGDKLWTH